MPPATASCGSGHGIGNAKAQFLPHAIEWVWKGYGSKRIK